MDTPSSTDHQPDAWTAFGLGVLGGVVGGLLLTSLGAILLAPIILVFAGGFALRPPFGAAGILGGWGTTWIALLVAAQAHCDPTSCSGGDLTPWTMFGGGLLAASIGLLLIGVRRPPWAIRVVRAARSSGAAIWLRAVRAALIGFAVGLATGTPWAGGWAIGALVALLFVMTRRAAGRRVEILWFALGILSGVALLALR